MDINEHEIADQLPKPTEKLSIQSVSHDKFHSLIFGNTIVPSTAEDLIRNQDAQITLHVTSFRNATIVSLLFPHYMTDVMGQHALIKAWSLVLAGREADVPVLAGTFDDVMATVGTAADTTEPEPYILASRTMSRLGRLYFGLRYFWDIIWSPRAHEKVICLPAAVVQRLREEAQNDLARSSHGTVPFISEGDVLTAFLTCLVARSLSQPRPITLVNIVDARSRIQTVFPLQTKQVYIQNLVFRTHVFLSATESVQESLGHIAAKVREAIAEQAIEPQLRAQVRSQRQAREIGEQFVLLGDPNALMLFFSNWSKGDFFNTIDFRPAVLNTRDTNTADPPGNIFYHYAYTIKRNWVTRNSISILGKDHQGDYWAKLTLAANIWSNVAEEVAKLDI